MLKKFAIGLIAIFGLIICGSFLLPSKVHLERETTINAKPEAIYPYISDFKKFNLWSPWADIDPKTKYTYSGPEQGIGAKVSWTSDDQQVGNGSQEIVEATANKRIKNRLTFDGDESFATYTLTPSAEKTKIVWTFETELGMNPAKKYMGLIIEKMLAPVYEKGLKSLKERVEKAP